MGFALLIVTLIAAVIVYTLLKQTTDLRGRIAAADEAREAKRVEAETARADTREKREELEKVKAELLEARAKSKKRERESVAPGEKANKPMRSGSTPPASESSNVSAAVVRISNQELEAEHAATLEKIHAETTAMRTRMSELEARDAEREAQAMQALERARKKLETPAGQSPAPAVAAAPVAQPAPIEGKRPEEKVQALETQLEALERAAAERERKLARELERMSTEVRSAEKRANANQQLYQVAKGQMVVIEERLATLKKKYEGAVSPESLRKPTSISPAAVEHVAPAPVPTTESLHGADTVRPGDAAPPAADPTEAGASRPA